MKYKYTKHGDELRFNYCPICDKVKENPDFAINVAEGVYFCFSNNQGGRVEDLTKYDFDIGEIPELRKFIKKSYIRKSYGESKESGFNSYKEKRSSNFYDKAERGNGLYSSSLENGKDKKDIDLSNIFLSRKNNFLNDEWIKYLASRCIGTKYLKKIARLGKNDTMMIPLTNGKKVVGIKYRTLDKKIFSERDSQSDYLMNWQLVKDFKYIVIVEGEIDLLSALEVEFLNVVSLPFGAGNLKAIENQKDWLSKFEKIIIATDNDTQGKKSKDEIIKILSNVKEKLYEVDMGEFKDFNEVLISGLKDNQSNVTNLNSKTLENKSTKNKSDNTNQTNLNNNDLKEKSINNQPNVTNKDNSSLENRLKSKYTDSQQRGTNQTYQNNKVLENKSTDKQLTNTNQTNRLNNTDHNNFKNNSTDNQSNNTNQTLINLSLLQLSQYI